VAEKAALGVSFLNWYYTIVIFVKIAFGVKGVNISEHLYK
jgi:hypothetical protein